MTKLLFSKRPFDRKYFPCHGDIDAIDVKELLDGSYKSRVEAIIKETQRAVPRPDFTKQELDQDTLVMSVPFSGDGRLFEESPTTVFSHKPHAQVRDGRLEFPYPGTPDGPSIRRYMESQQEHLTRQLELLSEDVATNNELIANGCRDRAEQRRAAAQARHDAAAASGIALKK